MGVYISEFSKNPLQNISFSLVRLENWCIHLSLFFAYREEQREIDVLWPSFCLNPKGEGKCVGPV